MDLARSHSITDVTRRDIRRAFLREGVCWSGDLDDVAFLNRLYDLAELPSTDGRFDSAEGDIWQHRVNNSDWEDAWVFSDKRLQLADGPDEVFVRFLAETVHPVVRADRQQAREIVAMVNECLAPDGWELVEADSISGRPIYSPRRRNASHHAVSSANAVSQKVDVDYVHRQINRMTLALEPDPELAIGTAKELLETICRMILESRGKPVVDKPELPPLTRRALDELRLIPDGIPDETKGARTIKSILGSLSTIAQGLAELRNLYGTGHGKSGTAKGLSSRHARLAVGAASTLAVFLIETHETRHTRQMD